MAKNPDEQNTVPVNGELFASRLKEKGLTHKELARASKVSARKISDCVASKPAKPSILRALMPHLDLSYEEITGAIPEQERPRTPHKSVKITHNTDGSWNVLIVFAKSFDPPLKPHALKMVQAISTLLGFDDGFDDDSLGALAGSLIVTVSLSRRDTVKLANAFISGALESFDVVSITTSKLPLPVPADVPTRSTRPESISKQSFIAGAATSVKHLVRQKPNINSALDQMANAIAAVSAPGGIQQLHKQFAVLRAAIAQQGQVKDQGFGFMNTGDPGSERWPDLT